MCNKNHFISITGTTNFHFITKKRKTFLSKRINRKIGKKGGGKEKYWQWVSGNFSLGKEKRKTLIK